MQEDAGSGRLDVQIVICRGLPPSGEKRAKRDIATKVARGHGKLVSEYRLLDGTEILRAFITPHSLKDVSEDPHVERIERTAFFSAS